MNNHFKMIISCILISACSLSASKRNISSRAGLQELINSNPAVVVKVGATWCPSCRTADKEIARLENDADLSGIVIASIDADSSPDIVEAFGINGLPTFLYFENGQLIKKEEGTPEAPRTLKGNITQNLARARSAASNPVTLPATVTSSEVPAQIQQEEAREIGQGQPAPVVETSREGASCWLSVNDFLSNIVQSTKDAFNTAFNTVRSWFN